MMKYRIIPTVLMITASVLAAQAATASARSIPSVVVTVENSAPSRGAFQTPFWVGMHDGSFDLYDRDLALGDTAANPQLVPAPAVERLAEDGNTGPLSEQFSILQPQAPQATLTGPSGPLAPQETASKTLNVDPAVHQFFSYGSMVIPSNDAFIANGNAQAHPLFDSKGRFVGKSFSVSGSEILDAGTELNTEIASDVAFLAQAAPDTGAVENGAVVLHPGFLSGLSFPDGVLSQPVFGGADFASNQAYRAATISFKYIDLGNRLRFVAGLSPKNEVSAEKINSNASGRAILVSRDADRVRVRIQTSGLSGPIQMAHLHNAAEGVNGPVVVNLESGIKGNSVIAQVRASDIVGDLANGEDPMVSLLNEMAAGNIYVNIHTAAFPDGELRGQVDFRRSTPAGH